MHVYVNKRLNSIKAIVILQKMTSMWISFTISLWTFWSGISWLSMEGQKAFRFYQKYLHFCSEDERKFYGFGTTWWWV